MLRKSFLLVLLNAMLIYSSCKGQKNTASEDVKDFPDMELIMEENYSGSEVEETQIIKDQKSLSAFFGKINRTRKPGLPIPEVDFSKEMLFVWCAGAKVTEMPDLHLVKETKEAYVLSKRPKTDKIESKSITSPFRIYKLHNNMKDIVFKEVDNR
jgi:hypothetical protein